MKKLLGLTVILTLILLGFFFYKDYHDLSRISYHGRTYNKSNLQVQSLDSIQKKFGARIVSTGEFVKGYVVYRSEEALKSPYVDTVIFLKLDDDKFLIFSLSGGP